MNVPSQYLVSHVFFDSQNSVDVPSGVPPLEDSRMCSLSSETLVIHDQLSYSDVDGNGHGTHCAYAFFLVPKISTLMNVIQRYRRR